MKSKKASFRQTFGLLFLSIGLLLAVRWLFVEPFIIPSGSMIPQLLIHDHIFVSKMSFGVRVPFMKKWLWQWDLPKRGDVVVFNSVEGEDIYLIKRIVGLPGDEIKTDEKGQLYINGVGLPFEKISEHENLDQFVESIDAKRHRILLKKGQHFAWGPIKVPEGHVFAMGDNRDNSNDSRFWGPVPKENLVGRALFIWYSCAQTIPQSQVICDPRTTRWSRLFSKVQ